MTLRRVLHSHWFWVMKLAGIGTLIVVVFILLIGYGPVRWGCKNTAIEMGVEWKWSFTTDCLVQTGDGTWLPLDAYRGTEEVER